MKDKYLKTPNNKEDWLQIAAEFNSKWNYPCCLGAIDVKHIAIQQPADTGSEFFNYKHFFSIILLAMVDANYKFIYLDVGAAGRAGDAGIFANSALKKALTTNSLDLPDVIALQGIPAKVSYHVVGDDAFPLHAQLMKPYPYCNLDKEKRIFNCRLSRAQRVVENSFCILAHRWRVFLTTTKLSPEKVIDIIFAACCLHNLMIEKNKASYITATDLEDADHTLVRGTWRNDQVLNSMQPTNLHNAPKDAKSQRGLLANYFNNHGSVPWQLNMVV